MKLILLGAPGAGKGTQADAISSRLGIPQISTGNALRKAIADDTATGRLAAPYMSRGELVPDEIVLSILKERLLLDDCKNGYILDGIPRTLAQAEAIQKMGIEIDKVVNLDVSDDTILERLSGRRVCEVCGASFHVKYLPSTKGEYCDKCGAKLIIREDDKPETIRQRLQAYHEKTEPLVDFYEKLGILVTVNGQEDVASTTEMTRKALGV